MFDDNGIRGAKGMLLAGILASGILVSAVAAQSAAPAGGAAPAGKTAGAGAPYRYEPRGVPKHAALYYGLEWGVDSLRVKAVESGELIRFSYRVIDADKAQTLNDNKVEPSLIDPQAGVQLVVPSLEKVGQLRQKSTPEVGRSYWMAFSNKGGLVKRGDRVNVVIGQFRANGLLVE